MSDNKDYYEILGIKRSASPQEIKEAYLYWVNILHPDRMGKMPERIQLQAEEDLKKVNEAYGVLSDPRKRAQYDKKTGISVDVEVSSYPEARVKGKPKLEIYPKTIFFDRALPYVKQQGVFFIRNVGGEYSKIMISTPPQWIKIIQTKPIYPDKKLPMQIDIEAIATDWGKTISSKIKVRLDESEASVKIELRTRKKH
jgi:curved DNA-binding protein CbpA